MNLTALLVTNLGSRNKNKHSEFWYLTTQRYLLYKFWLKKDKPWVFFSKFRCRTILMHFLLLICGKFTRAQLAHQIFITIFTTRRVSFMGRSNIFTRERNNCLGKNVWCMHMHMYAYAYVCICIWMHMNRSFYEKIQMFSSRFLTRTYVFPVMFSYHCHFGKLSKLSIWLESLLKNGAF
jgi:hypothetical protein